MAARTGVVGALRSTAALSQRRHASSKIIPHGKGGRSSVAGRVASVFGAVGHWSPADGFLGRYLIQRMGKSGTQVVVPYYGDELHTRYLRVMGDLGQIHFQEYGILDERSIDGSVAYSNVAINLTGLDYKTRHYSPEDVHVTGAANIARAAKAAGVERFIHVSALGADSSNTKSEVLRTKGLGEEAVLAEFPEATIIRPGIMFGTEDRFIRRLADLLALPGPFPMLNEGKAVKQPVYVADVAQAIINAIDDPEAPGTTYELVGPKQYTIAELCKYISETSRKEAWTIPVPGEKLLGEEFDFATGAVMFGLKVAGFARIGIVPNEEEFYKYANDCVFTKRAPGLAELGVKASTLEEKGLDILRMYRSHLYHDDIDAILSKSKPTMSKRNRRQAIAGE